MKTLEQELNDQEIRRLLMRVMGSSRLGVVLVTIFTLTFLGWFADGLFGIADGYLRHWLGDQDPPKIWSGLLLTLPLLTLLAWLLVVARRSQERLVFRARRVTSPWNVAGLILFLSPEREENLEELRAVAGELESADTRSRIRGPWRMPLEALAFHVFGGGGPLREVVIVDSSGDRGSHRWVEEFQKLLDRLWPGRVGDTYPGLGGGVRVRTIGQILPDLEGGVNAFEVDDMVQAADRLFRALVDKRLPAENLVFDLTGGPKLATVAGTAVTLAEGRRFQYVDTHTYEVALYEPTYEPPPKDQPGDAP